MVRKKEKNKVERLIRIPEVMHALKISPQQFYMWHEEGKFKIIQNKNNKPCILESSFKEIAHSDFARAASVETLKNHFERLEEDKLTGKISIFEERIKNKVLIYRSYIRTLEKVHSNYQYRTDLFDNESALLAAYMLHARVINLLNLFCMSLNSNYYASPLMRLIDETIDLAEYFIITENTKTGRDHLSAWFRENKSPSHLICRKVISKFMGSLLGKEVPEIHEETMSDLYGAKSKSIHPIYNEILMVSFNPKIEKRKLMTMSFNYEQCTNFRALFELSEFFQSSIWSAVQGLLLCFQDKMPLTDEDKATLISLNEQFDKESD